MPLAVTPEGELVLNPRTSQITIGTAAAQILGTNYRRSSLQIQVQGPGAVVFRQDQAPTSMQDGFQVQPGGLLSDSGEVHKGPWYAMADQANTIIYVTEFETGLVRTFEIGPQPFLALRHNPQRTGWSLKNIGPAVLTYRQGTPPTGPYDGLRILPGKNTYDTAAPSYALWLISEGVCRVIVTEFEST